MRRLFGVCAGHLCGLKMACLKREGLPEAYDLKSITNYKYKYNVHVTYNYVYYFICNYYVCSVHFLSRTSCICPGFKLCQFV